MRNFQRFLLCLSGFTASFLERQRRGVILAYGNAIGRRDKWFQR